MTSIAIDGAAVPERDEPGGQVTFTLRRWPVLWLSLRIVLLSIVTLGFYRFWGKTRLRHLFWRHVSIAGDPLEYTGRPVELLLGFLAAIVILIPVFAIPTVAQLVTADERILVAVGLIQTLVIFYLIPLAVFRARRYLLTRTLWRGIACGQDGSAFRYANLVLRWNLLVAVTLGVAYPWMRAARQRYLVAHSWYGGARFAFDAAGRPLLRAWIPALACVWALGISAVAGVTIVALIGEGILEGWGSEERVLAVAAAAAIGFWLVFLIFYLRYRVREFRHFTGGTTLGEVRFASSLPMGRVLFLHCVLYILVALTILVMSLLVGFGIGVLVYATGGQGAEMVALVGVLMLLPMFWAYFVIRTAWLRVGLMRAVARTLTVRNPGAVEDIIRNRGAQAPRYGEGLADALDVGAF